MNDIFKDIKIPIDGANDFLLYWAAYGQQMVVTLVILVVGIFLLKRFGPKLENYLSQTKFGSSMSGEIMICFYAVAGVLLLGVALRNLGVDGVIVRRLTMAIGLTAVALFMLLRPYMPKLPFKVGNMIRTGNLFGKVEDISLLNTRLRTFDGLIVIVPNAKILNDYVINYHTTPNRRVKANVAIRYDQDIIQAKRIVESILVADPRVLATPRPVVYVTSLDQGWVQLGGRGWVKNPKAWVTRCEVLEKIKYAFDQAGIEIAFPRRDVYLHPGNDAMAIGAQPDEMIASLMSEEMDGAR